MTDYSGPERRTEPRRQSDKCANCDVLWKYHDEDKNNHRKEINGDIQELKTCVEKIASSMTPWKVFALSMVVLIGSIGWLAAEIKTGNTEIKSAVSRVHQRVTEQDTEKVVQVSAMKDSMHQINLSIQSIDGRLKQVEKALEVPPKKVGGN